MYCPNCGQAQASEDVRYCSRCGLSLWELARWLRDGANAPWSSIQSLNWPSPRKKGIRLGAKSMFIGGVLLPPALGLALLVDSPAPLFLPVMVFFAGLVWALYCRLFAEAGPVARKQSTTLYGPDEYLPPAQVNSAPALRSREPNTAEILQPASVTEYTTNLLKKHNQT